MNNVASDTADSSDTAMTKAIAATLQTKADAAPLLAHGRSIGHPDPELSEQQLGQQLMAKRAGGRRSRRDGWHPPAIAQGQRERREC